MNNAETKSKEEDKIRRLPLELLVELLRKRAAALRRLCEERRKTFYSAETLEELKEDERKLPLQVAQLAEKECGLIAQLEERRKERLGDGVKTRRAVNTIQLKIDSLHEQLDQLKKREATMRDDSSSSLDKTPDPVRPSKRPRTQHVRRTLRSEPQPRVATPRLVSGGEKAQLRKELDGLVYENQV